MTLARFWNTSHNMDKARQRGTPVRDLLKIQQSFQGPIFSQRDPGGNRDNTHIYQSGKSSAARKSGQGIIENPTILSGEHFSQVGSGREPRQHPSEPLREKFGSGEIRSGDYQKASNLFRGPFRPGGIRNGTETTLIYTSPGKVRPRGSPVRELLKIQ